MKIYVLLSTDWLKRLNSVRDIFDRHLALWAALRCKHSLQLSLLPARCSVVLACKMV